MVKNELLKDAIYGVLYFSVVVGLINLVRPHGAWAIVGVLYACTFCLYWFFYKIRDIKHYFVSFAVLATILLAFSIAGKSGLIGIVALYTLLPIWILWSRRKKLKEAYVEFETTADKVFIKKEKEEKKVVKAKKPSRTTDKNPRQHKQKDKARKKNTSKTSKSSTVKKRSQKSRKKAASD